MGRKANANNPASAGNKPYHRNYHKTIAATLVTFICCIFVNTGADAALLPKRLPPKCPALVNPVALGLAGSVWLTRRTFHDPAAATKLTPQQIAALKTWTRNNDLSHAQFDISTPRSTPLVQRKAELIRLYRALVDLRERHMMPPPEIVRRAFKWKYLGADEQEQYKKIGTVVTSRFFMSFTSSEVLEDFSKFDDAVLMAHRYDMDYPGIFGAYSNLLESDAILTLKTCDKRSMLRDITLLGGDSREEEALMPPRTKFKITEYSEEVIANEQELKKRYPHAEFLLKKEKTYPHALHTIHAKEVCEELPPSEPAQEGSGYITRENMKAAVLALQKKEAEGRKEMEKYLDSCAHRWWK